jgi:hypothetical protein
MDTGCYAQEFADAAEPSGRRLMAYLASSNILKRPDTMRGAWWGRLLSWLLSAAVIAVGTVVLMQIDEPRKSRGGAVGADQHRPLGLAGLRLHRPQQSDHAGQDLQNR